MADGAVLREPGSYPSKVVDAVLEGLKIIRKTADETVNNSATLQDDDELLFAVGANEVWAFDLVMIIDSGAVPDFKYSFTMPAGGDCFVTAADRDASNASIIQGGSIGQGTTTFNIRGIGVGQVFGHLHGIAVNGSTAGNLQLQWAQNTADVSDTKVLTNSYIIARKLN